MLTNQDLYYSFMQNKNIREQWGQSFFRDIFIPELLGSNTHSILYWAGKRMAREFPIATPDGLIEFFNQTDLGNLAITGDQKTPIIFQLSGSIVEQRLNFSGEEADFMFEAGFLAQSIEHQRGVVAEAEMDPKKNKKGVVTIQVHVDPNNPATDLSNQPDLRVAEYSNHSDQDEQPTNE